MSPTRFNAHWLSAVTETDLPIAGLSLFLVEGGPEQMS
jgi:hypothetical protein